MEIGRVRRGNALTQNESIKGIKKIFPKVLIELR